MAMTPPSASPELDDLVARSRRLVVQVLADTARPAADAATTYVADKGSALGVGIVLTLAAVVLLVTGLVLLVSQYVPLWGTCLGIGAVTLPTGLLLLSRAKR